MMEEEFPYLCSEIDAAGKKDTDVERRVIPVAGVLGAWESPLFMAGFKFSNHEEELKAFVL